MTYPKQLQIHLHMLFIGLIAGIALGLSMAAPPGPVNAVIAGKTSEKGWSYGFRVGFGALTSDALFFVIAYIGSSFLNRYREFEWISALIGSFLLFYLAINILFNPGNNEQ